MAIGAILMAGCANDHPSTRIMFKDATVNGMPERLILDTGSSYMLIFDDSAKHAGMDVFLHASPDVDDKFRTMTMALAKPTIINLGGEENRVQPLMGNLSRSVIMVAADGARIDGLISWPEVRDNILIFDGTEHKISSVKTLPAGGLEGWIRMPIGYEDQLTLKPLMPNGQFGTVLVDTGAYFGVALPPEQWNKWRAAHPNAPSGSVSYMTPGEFGVQAAEEAWADEIQLGTLTLTDVPVHEANESEMKAGPSYAGTLGLYALARLDLVLDGKDNVAFVRTRPKPGPFYPGITRPGVDQDPSGGPLGHDWMIEGPVTINPKHIRQFAGEILMSEAVAKLTKDDHAGAMEELQQAIDFNDKNDDVFLVRGTLEMKDHDTTRGLADINHALELNPDNVLAYQARAQYELIHNEPADAIVDCTKAIFRDVNYMPAYELRGVAKQIQNDIPGAISDFAQTCVLYPYAEFPQLYREVLQRWTGTPPRDLTDYIAYWSDAWPKAIGSYLSGHLSETALLALAGSSHDAAEQTCQAYYFIGFAHLLNHDPAGARECWQKCVDTQQTELNEYAFAQTLLKAMDAADKK